MTFATVIIAVSVLWVSLIIFVYRTVDTLIFNELVAVILASGMIFMILAIDILAVAR